MTYALHIACIVLLLIAYGDHDYGYYIFLRWVICASFAYFSLKAHDQKKESWTWIYGATAGLYNPFATLELGRELWQIVNAATIVLIALNAWQNARAKAKSSNPDCEHKS